MNRRLLHLGFLTSIAMTTSALASDEVQTLAQEWDSGVVRSLSIVVVGASYLGVRYEKRADLTRDASGNRLDYACRIGVAGKADACACPDVDRVIGEREIDAVLAFLATFDDQSENATCCDHSWTEIGLDYFSKAPRKMFLSFDPLIVREMVDFCATPLAAFDANDWASQVQLGKQLHEAGLYQRARDALERAAVLNPDADVELHSALGSIYRVLRNYAQALAAYQRVLRLQPDDVPTLLLIGELQAEFGHVSEAIAQYQRVLELKPSASAQREAYANLGHIHQQAGQFLEAADAFNEALSIDPNDAFTRYSLGKVYLELKDERAALRQYEELVRLESEHAEDLHIAIYQQAVRDRPQDPDAHFNLGNAYFQLAERYEEAIEPYQQAIHLNPDLELAYSRLGYCYIELGRYDDAIAAFSGAIRINPHDVPDRVNLGLAYSHTGEHAQAIEHLEAAVRLQPDSAIAHMNLGYVLRSSGQSSKAIEPLGRAIRLGPDDALAHYNLARAYFDLSRYREAVEEFQRAIRLNRSEAELAEFHFHLGETYSRLKRYRLAAKSFAAAVDLKPNYVEARFRLGVAYFRLRDLESALSKCRDLKAVWDERLGAELESLIGISCSR